MRNEQLPRSTDDPGAGPTQVITCVADIAACRRTGFIAAIAAQASLKRKPRLTAPTGAPIQRAVTTHH